MRCEEDGMWTYDDVSCRRKSRIISFLFFFFLFTEVWQVVREKTFMISSHFSHRLRHFFFNILSVYRCISWDISFRTFYQFIGVSHETFLFEHFITHENFWRALSRRNNLKIDTQIFLPILFRGALQPSPHRYSHGSQHNGHRMGHSGAVHVWTGLRMGSKRADHVRANWKMEQQRNRGMWQWVWAFSFLE